MKDVTPILVVTCKILSSHTLSIFCNAVTIATVQAKTTF